MIFEIDADTDDFEEKEAIAERICAAIKFANVAAKISYEIYSRHIRFTISI